MSASAQEPAASGDSKPEEGQKSVSASSVISESDDAAEDKRNLISDPAAAGSGPSADTLAQPSQATAKQPPSNPPSTPKQQSSKSPSTSSENDLLPDFQPNPYTVVLGRGKQNIHCPGNLRLKEICEEYLPYYENATSKKPKSLMVEEIVKELREECPKEIEHVYVRYHNGKYRKCTEKDLREKITAYFRDRLHPNYKSSSKSKTAKRQRKLQEERKKNPLPPKPKAKAKVAGQRRSLPLPITRAAVDNTTPHLSSDSGKEGKPPPASASDDEMAAETLLMFCKK